MQSKKGRPKKESGKGAIVKPHIGGMETLGPLPVGGVMTKHKEGVTKKSAGHSALGFGKSPMPHGVGGLKKKKKS